MAVAGGDYVHFVVEYGGKIDKCRVTDTALLNRERMSRKDAGYAQLIAIFVRHRAEIEHLALAKLQRQGHSDRGVVVTPQAPPATATGRWQSQRSIDTNLASGTSIARFSVNCQHD